MDSNVLSCGAATLIGTVHVSPLSRERVISTINVEQPDVVAVELDAARYVRMRDNPGERGGALDLLVAVLTGKLTAKGALVNYALLRSQSRFADDIGLHAGEADMLPAVSTAHDINSRAALIDDSGQTTVNEVGESLDTDGLLDHILNADIIEVLSAYVELKAIIERNGLDTITSPREGVEVLETIPYDDLDTLLSAYEQLAPDGLFDHILHERNKQMAGHIHWLRQQENSVVAVMGRAHVPGVRRLLESPTDIPEDYIVAPPYVGDIDE